MASPVRMILGSFAFVIFWVPAVFPAIPLLPIGRSAGSLFGAVLMVIFQVLTPAQAYASIDFSILVILFGTMVVSVYLERADAFLYLGKLLSWKSQGAKDLIFRVCLVSAITSAFFTNDTWCIVLTQVVLKIARQNNFLPHPFLIALASSANVGSSATPTGNPQNLVIAISGDISFLKFLSGIAPSALLGVFLNSMLLLCIYWKLLSSHEYGEDRNAEIAVESGIPWTAMTAAIALMVLNFKDAQPCLDKVSYTLLVFFCGMFITVDGFENTGIPSYLWKFLEPYAHFDHASGVAILALIILILSNAISNVTTVLLLGQRIGASAESISPMYVKKAWLILAWVSTVAGNLTIFGSAANVIVCEKARRDPNFSYNLSFWRHLKFGVPSTIIVLTIGLTLIR